MKISELYTRDYLTVDDLGGHEMVVEIVKLRIEVQNGLTRSAVLDLKDQSKPLLLNRKLALDIAEFLGDETDDWAGKAIEFYCEQIKHKGDIVDALRVRNPNIEKRDSIPTADHVKTPGSKAPKAASKAERSHD